MIMKFLEEFMSRRSLVLSILPLFLVLLAASQTNAQITPHFDCTEPVYTDGVLVAVKAFYGYTNSATTNVTINEGSNNFFSPNPGGQYSGAQTMVFEPGYHERAFFITVAMSGNPVYWIVQNKPGLMNFNWSSYCDSRLITYQGKLTLQGAAINQPHDLQFKFYDQLRDGTARGTVEVRNVPVTNGVFTAQLDVASAFRDNPDARFIEISVRPSGATGGFTTLSPRQLITFVPFALRARSAESVSGGEVQIPYKPSSYSIIPSECDEQKEYGLLKLIGSSMYVCTPTGWKQVVLQ